MPVSYISLYRNGDTPVEASVEYENAIRNLVQYNLASQIETCSKEIDKIKQRLARFQTLTYPVTVNSTVVGCAKENVVAVIT